MKNLSLVVAFLSAAAPVVADESADLPAPFPEERYTGMKASSPFALATAPAAAPEPDFARDMYISAAARIAGQDLVSVTARDMAKTYTLVSGGEPVEGITLVSVNWSPLVGRTTAVVSKSGKTSNLQFNEQILSAPMTAAAMPAGNPNGGRTVNPAGVRPGVPGGQAPRVLNAPGVAPNGARPPRRIIRRPSS